MTHHTATRAHGGGRAQKKLLAAGLFGSSIEWYDFFLYGTAAALSHDAFITWGWRVPFLANALLFPVVLYIQTKVEDTPEFRDLQAAAQAKATKAAEAAGNAVAKAPLAEVLRHHWRKILLGCGLLAATNSLFYISIAGVRSYATAELGMDYDGLLAMAFVSSVIGAGVILWSGGTSDRVGRRPLLIIGAIGIMVWAFPYFWLVDTASLALFMVAVTVGAVFQSMTYGPLAAFMSEIFAPRIRYSGMSLAYQLAAITISGGTPMIMTAIIAGTGSTTLVAVFVMAMALVTLLCTLALKETNPAAVREDPRAVRGIDAAQSVPAQRGVGAGVGGEALA